MSLLEKVSIEKPLTVRELRILCERLLIYMQNTKP